MTRHILIFTDDDGKDGSILWRIQTDSTRVIQTTVRLSDRGSDTDFDPLLITLAPDMRDVLADLLDRSSQTGGWEAPCWAAARKLLKLIRRSDPDVSRLRMTRASRRSPENGK